LTHSFPFNIIDYYTMYARDITQTWAFTS